jgi:hypothetical protein
MSPTNPTNPSNQTEQNLTTNRNNVTYLASFNTIKPGNSRNKSETNQDWFMGWIG